MELNEPWVPLEQTVEAPEDGSHGSINHLQISYVRLPEANF
jgi:hypothetical protein